MKNTHVKTQRINKIIKNIELEYHDYNEEIITAKEYYAAEKYKQTGYKTR